jgi:short-subunit dehydrogenase
MTNPPSPKVAFITGASSGIGHDTALAFAREGTHVIAIARRLDRLSQLEQEFGALPEPHGDILALTADVQDSAALHTAVQRGLERFGRLDYLIANAGIGLRGDFASANWSDIETVLRTNIDGVLHSIRAAVPAMRQTGGGHIIIISSVVAHLPMPYAAIYGASKAFVSSLAHSLRFEFADDNIRVTDMLVGRTATEFNDKRLGKTGRTGGGVPTMSAAKVAQAVVRATKSRRGTITPRLFDRLILLANFLAPGVIGRIARRQYK